MPKSVTLRDVAQAADVSAQTVSRVINNKPNVAEETRQRVRQAIRQLGYRPNTVARTLASRRSYALGVISYALYDDFFAGVVMAAEREARARGYVCVLTFADQDPESLLFMYNLMLERQVDGIMLLAPHPCLKRPTEFPVPVITMTCPIRHANVINVDVDNVDGAYQAVLHLIELGHRRIGMITGPRGWKAVDDRSTGARRAMAQIGQLEWDPWIETSAGWDIQSGYRAARALLSRHPGLSALFCHNDPMALGAYRALHELGRRIPDDVSIVGYDDLPLCQYTTPELTSVRQPSTGLGELLAQLLIDAVEHGTSAQNDLLIRTELIVRSSTVPVWATEIEGA
jgi:DNA-binding LacI/PurR family transcriptional regulator